MEILLIGVLLLAGLAFGTLGSHYFGVPRVVGYILIGMLFSPDLLGDHLGLDAARWTQPLVAIALGFVAYLIGGAATVGQLRRLGVSIITATVGKVAGAFLLVFGGFVWLGVSTPDLPGWAVPLVLAALATITAPAAIVAIIHQYRARGPLTTALLGMVAMDDALGVVIFSVALALLAADGLVSALPLVVWEIVAALVIGGIGGWLIERISRLLHEHELRLVALIGAIVLLVGLAEAWHFSGLLAAMTLGFTARWFGGVHAERLFEPVEQLEEMVFVLFFTFAGLYFDLSVAVEHGWLILLFFVLRAAGQVIGSWIGARLGGAPPAIANNVGLGMLPQGGVAVGMALMLEGQPRFAEVATLAINIITASTLLTESIGALAARFGLRRAGELNAANGGHDGGHDDEGK
ncbi:cation:proton antiporter [Guyparkeria sp. TX1]|uniref:cation:proton antiporter n=1 Tax=Guyparkeria sp. TX1 TaxID=3115001 RepID=UPI003977E10A